MDELIEKWDRKAWAQEKREEEIALKLESLRSRNPGTRAEAARRLGELKAGTDALLEAIDDPNSTVRAAAANALGYSASNSKLDEAIESLLAAIDDPNDYVCSAAIAALGRLRAAGAREQIEACLEDPNPHIVSAAIIALGRIGPPEAADMLVPFMKSDHPYILGAAARALGTLGYSAAGPDLLAGLEKTLSRGNFPGSEILKERLVEALAVLKVQEAVPALVRVAQNEVGLRSLAVRALIALQAEAAVPELIRLLEDPSSGLRKSVIRMTAELGFREAIPFLRPMLNDGSVEVRQAAVSALSRLGDQVSYPAIRALALHDPNPFLRVQAVNSLATLGREKALPDLLLLAEDVNTYVRKVVAQNFGHFDRLPPEALEALQRLAAPDSAPEVASIAQEVLAARGEALETPPPAPTRPAVRVPEEIAPHRQALLDLLSAWQTALPGLAKSQTLEEIAQTDAALAQLIQRLRTE
jgi:HEAT repeat protein